MRNLKRVLSLALAALMLMGMMVVGAGAASKDFTDADEITNVEAVDVMVALGILEGGDKGDFQPNSILTREQAAKIICYMLLGEEAAEKLTTNYAIFSDVPANRWSAPYISYCVNLGILAGDGAGHFYPEGKLTGVAFAKMLLVCLGYNATRENYVGNNWEINTSAAAIAAGIAPTALDLSKELSRQDAAQMAFNTLQATMVEYLNDNTIIIGGETIVSTTGKASAVAQSPYADTMDTENLQFAEKYFKDLQKKPVADAFGRPSINWVYGKTDIGTYLNTKQLVEEYTDSVTSRELYDLLGKSIVEDYTITVYADGVKQPVSVVNEIVKNNKTEFSVSGKGTLLQVFVDKDNEDVVVTAINTYLAIASADYNEKAETATFDIYGVKKVGNDFVRVVKGNNSEDKVSNVKVDNDDIYVADIVADDVVLVTLAEGAVQSLTAAEVVSDVTITSFTKNSKIVADGETYNYAVTTDYNYEVLDEYDQNNMKEKTYNVYLDPYGNLIGLEYVTVADNYVFITGYDQNGSNLANKTWSANAIFLDGTSKVIDVKNNGALSSTNNEDTEKQVNKWYTYTESNGVYTLSLVETTWTSGDKVAQSFVNDSAEIEIDYQHPALKMAYGDKTYVYGNNDSVYLTAQLDDVGAYTVISGASSVSTGIKNTSIITYKEDDELVDGTSNGLDGAAYVLFKSNGYIIGAVVVGEDAAVSKNLVYVNSSAPNLESYNSSADEWTWTREVIYNGESIELTEVGSELTYLDNMTQYAWYVVSYNADGNVTGAKKITASETNIEYVDDYTSGAIQAAIDTGKETVLYEEDFSNDTVLPKLIEQTLYLSSDDRNGFFIDEDATVVFIQKNDGKTTTTYEVGPAAVEAAIDNLNANSYGKYTYELTAVIERGAAKVVIIRDTVNGTAGSGDKEESISSEIVVTIEGTNIFVSAPSKFDLRDQANAIEQALLKEGYTDVQTNIAGNAITTVTAKDGGMTFTFLVNQDTATTAVVDTPAELTTALADSSKDTIYLGSGTYTIATGAINRDLTIIGNGDTTLGNVKVAAGDYDVNISGVNFSVAGGYGVNLPHNYLGDVTIENCTFTSRYGIYVDDAGKITVKDCIFNVTVCPFGWSDADEVVFTGNTVNGNPERAYIEDHDSTTKVTSDYPLMSEVED